MPDVSSVEYQPVVDAPIKVKDISKVPLNRGQLFLNSGQTNTLRDEYPHLFEVGVVTTYVVGEQSEKSNSKFDTEEMCLVNLRKISKGLLPYSDSFMRVFVPIITEQLRTDAQSLQAAKFLVEVMKTPDNLKLVRAKRTFLHNARTVSAFLESLDQLDEFDMVERFRPEMQKTVQIGLDALDKNNKFGRGSVGWVFGEKDYAPNVYTETEKRAIEYKLRLNKKIEKHDLIIRMPDGMRRGSTFSVTRVTAPENFVWEKAYDINSVGTHTTGRREGLEEFINNGIEPFATPVGEGFSKTPAVVCGFVGPGGDFQDSETIKRNYGDIFNPESEGFVVVLGPDVKEAEGYEVVGVEARIEETITPEMAKAIVVGNKKMEQKATDAIKKKGLQLPVILLSKTEINI